MDPGECAQAALQELLGACAVLPEQFWRRDGRAAHPCGERALMWAVLADGIDCYRRNAHPTSVQQQLEFDEAEHWISGSDWDWPFSFVNLCEAFGFDPVSVRRALKGWRDDERHAAFRRQRFRSRTLRAA